MYRLISVMKSLTIQFSPAQEVGHSLSPAHPAVGLLVAISVIRLSWHRTACVEVTLILLNTVPEVQE